MLADAPFYISVAALSASLAGLAGLVAALSRSSGLGALELFRLREIVEFAFANMLLAVSTIPVAALVGPEAVARVNGSAAVLILLAHMVVLFRRADAVAVERYRAWSVVALTVNVVAFGLAAVAVLTGSLAAYQLLLLALLARPMAAFLLVLSRFSA